MHLKLFFALGGCVLSVTAAPFLEGRDTCTSNDLNLPSEGMQSYNGVYFGFAPDDSSGGGQKTTMKTINADTGKKASTYGYYSQITGTPYTGSQLISVLSDVVDSGAVFIPAVMPSIPFSDITPAVADQILAVLEQFTNQGVEVWLRFAHEMNYYTTPAEQKYHGTQAQFITAWRTVHAAVASNPKILMFWSPNVDKDMKNLQSWWPGADYVDIVGMDYYPKEDSTTFSAAFDDFYNTFAKGYNKHFCLGETGSSHSDVSAKEHWVSAVSEVDLERYPCYKSATWFEYYKKGDKGATDFRVITGQSGPTVKQTLENFK